MIAFGTGAEERVPKALQNGHRWPRNAACGCPRTPHARWKVNARLIEFGRLRAINSDCATEVNRQV